MDKIISPPEIFRRRKKKLYRLEILLIGLLNHPVEHFFSEHALTEID